MPVPIKQLEYYVERQYTVDELNRAIEQPGPLVIGDMKGPHGVGKTITLAHLYDQLLQKSKKDYLAWADMKWHHRLWEKNNEDYLAWADLRDFSVPAVPTDETRLSRFFVSALGKYKDLLISLAGDLLQKPDKVSGELEKLYQEISIGRKPPNRFSRALQRFFAKSPVQLSELGINIGIVQPKIVFRLDQGSKDSIEKMSQELTIIFARHINKMVRRNRVIIFLDDFCHIEGTILEKWILDNLIPTLQKCKFILGRTDYQHSLPIPENPYPIPINNFTPEECSAYLTKVLGNGTNIAQWAKWVYAYCHGHPLFTALLVSIIQKKDIWLGQPDSEFKHFLDNSPDDSKNKAAVLAEELVGVMSNRNPDISYAMNAACILREFDREVLIRVLRGRIDDAEIDHVWASLKQLPMIESCVIAKKEERLLVHEFFASAREWWLGENAPDVLRTIHREAAEYYGLRLQKFEEETSMGIWGRMHHYESSDWQELSRLWLHHLMADPESPEVGIEFATRYFDAFFWWGDYIDFPFCKRLLDDLDTLNLPEGNRNKRWISLLKDFHNTFLPERRRGSDTAWTVEARAILHSLWDHGGLGNVKGEDVARWHLRSILQNYLADTYCLGHIDYSKAVQNYLASIKSFSSAEAIYHKQLENAPVSTPQRNHLSSEIEKEIWFGIWIKIWLAGVYVKNSEYDQALNVIGEADKAIYETDSSDREAIARVYCTRADAYFGQANWEKSFHEYALYALYALGFFIDDYNNGGDFYTLEFFREMLEHIGGRLMEIQEYDPALAQRWWSDLRSFWEPEGAYLLPDSIADSPVAAGSAIQLDSLGHIVSHSLPLPRILIAINEQLWKMDELSIPVKLVNKVQRTFMLLLERHQPEFNSFEKEEL